MWFGTAAAACASGLQLYPTGLTKRSNACANADTRRKWVTPHMLPVCTTSTAPALDQRAELLKAGEVLAGRDRRAHSTADQGVPVRVPAAYRLLDPREVDLLLNALDVGDRLLAGPRLVGIEHHSRRPTRSLVHLVDEPEAAKVARQVEAALELSRPESTVGEGRLEPKELVVLERPIEPRGVPADHPVTFSRACATVADPRPSP